MKTIEIRFQTADIIPAPYAHQYQIIYNFAEELSVDFQLIYEDRSHLSEDEIIDEGFTENDDFSWKGTLHQVWGKALSQLLTATNLKDKYPESAQENFVEIGINGQKGYPKNQAKWEYFLQEQIQAIYETAQKEAPLKLLYLKQWPNNEKVTLEINVLFSERIVKTSIDLGSKQEQKDLRWEHLNEILQKVYMGEYLAENATDTNPNKAGKYLNIGDGLWYELGKSLVNPRGNNRYLLELEKTLDALL